MGKCVGMATFFNLGMPPVGTHHVLKYEHVYPMGFFLSTCGFSYQLGLQDQVETGCPLTMFLNLQCFFGGG